MNNKEEFRVIVAGGRDFNDYTLMEKKLDFILSEKSKTHAVVVVSGTAYGADKLGECYAEKKGYKVDKFPAEWDKFGRSAGPMRNKQMGEYSNTAVIFWDGTSRGSAHMIKVIKELEKPYRVIKY